jgi:hypothetical protein
MQIFRRLIGIVIAILPFGIVLVLSTIKWRILAGRLVLFGYCLFTIGGLISCINFYLSFLRYPVHRLCGSTKEDYSRTSGIPFFGILSVVGLLHLPESIWLSLLAFVFLLIDTGGIPWFIVAVWKDDSFWCSKIKSQRPSKNNK